MARRFQRTSGFIASLLLFGCGGAAEEDREPTPGEVKAYIDKMQRDENKAMAKAIVKSRAKEDAVEWEHRQNMAAPNRP